uniref:Farnesyl diphosphate synthase 1 n=1 Tax=Matsumurasca onukii TaxID=2912585 RepID=A0A7D0AGQ9_MATON|nr:farnesyl diphosphate synthase 1 [Matsumurasca onukii]
MRANMWRSAARLLPASHPTHLPARTLSVYLQSKRLRDAAASILNDVDHLEPASVQEDQHQFEAVFPDIVQDLTKTTSKYADVELANKWCEKMLKYNMSGSSNLRGLAVSQSYRILAPAAEQTPQNLRLAYIMGWCLELLHTSLVLTQDLIDQADERRGKPCWYRQNPRQAPDGAPRIMEYAIYKLLKKYFRNKDYYVDAMELFHTVGEKAMLGKILDMETRGDPTLSMFDMTLYSTISKYRSAYHTFKLPVALALYMAGIRDTEMHRQARTIQLEMGNFYQAQSDFFNCYGGGQWNMKPGHDIADGRCTWLIVVALQRASPAQKLALIDSYGKREEEKINRVKEIYGEIGIPQTYRLYEEHTYELICNQIHQLSGGLPKQLFFGFLKTMTGR